MSDVWGILAQSALSRGKPGSGSRSHKRPARVLPGRLPPVDLCYNGAMTRRAVKAQVHRATAQEEHDTPGMAKRARDPQFG